MGSRSPFVGPDGTPHGLSTPTKACAAGVGDARVGAAGVGGAAGEDASGAAVGVGVCAAVGGVGRARVACLRGR